MQHREPKMADNNIYRRFSSSRREFIRSSTAIAASIGASSMLATHSALASSGASYASDLWEKTKAELAGGSHRNELNLHSWEGYTEEPVLDPFSKQTGAQVNPQMLISDPAAVNNLRSGGTKTWDIINLNNAWQRKQLYPEGRAEPF